MNRLTLHLFQGVMMGIVIFLLTACDDRIETGILPRDFTKEKREMLGELIKASIKSNPDINVLPDVAPYSIAYEHIQRLYNQVTNEARLDTQSPIANKWDWNREWEITIVDNPLEKFAYIIPGGNVFLSTGLLLSLNNSYELYYILAFEVSLMNERYLLDKLFQEYRIDRLDDFVKGKLESDGITLDEFAADFKWLAFDEAITGELDLCTVNRICKSSRYSRLGIIAVMDTLDETDQWLATRPAYDTRGDENYIENLETEIGVNCGNYRFEDKYENKVLANLPQ